MLPKSPRSVYAQLQALVNDIRAEVLSWIPTEVGEHLVGAKKELLAAVRGVIDEEIRWTEKRWEAAKARKTERATAQTAGETPEEKASARPKAKTTTEA